jgi:hypothetical protein
MEAFTEKPDHQWECVKTATQQIATTETSNAIYQHLVTSESEYQKEFHKTPHNIAMFTATKTDPNKEICGVTSEVKTEREMV